MSAPSPTQNVGATWKFTTFHCRPDQRFSGMARQVVDRFMVSLAS